MTGRVPVIRRLGEVRQLARGLRTLGHAAAPPTVLARVKARTGAANEYFVLETPVGRTFVAFNDQGISAVLRADSGEEFEREFRRRLGRGARPAARMPAQLLESLQRQLRGERTPALRFDLAWLSEFERAVLLKALEIPRGEVRPYSWIAREIGRPKAVRAVGSALAKNPIPLFIPCHRVVRADGYIGQYSLGGRSLKQTMLKAEGVDPGSLETWARSGVRYFGSDSTRIFCFPTCRHARRVSERHRVTFRAEEEARQAGYRPCKVCRPSAAA